MVYESYEKNKDEEQIEVVINSEIDDVLHGILVVNLDNYSAILDKIGQDRMDRVLNKIDDSFRQIFRGSDVVVKLKFVEFIILARNIRELGNVEFLAGKLLDTLRRMDSVDDMQLTCTVGISIYPFHGIKYEELKNKAYRAMYRAKANGKDTLRLYDAALTKILYHDYLFDKKSYEKFKNMNLYDMTVNKSLLEICANLLIDDRDALSAMHAILEIGCLYLGFSRVYFYAPEGVDKIMRKKLTYTNPGFEYTAESEVMKALREDMQIRISERYSSLALIDSDDEKVDEEVRLTLKDKDINQLLYFPLGGGGDIFRGAFIFENMSVDKISMTDEDLVKIDEQMRSIQAYFFSSHSKRFAKENMAKLELFENIPANIYIIDEQTHEIEFANHKAREGVDGGHIGELCYSTFCHRSSPCESCPLKNMDLNDEHANGVLSYYNYATREWCYNLYSWLGVYENKGKAVMISVDVSGFVNDLNQI
ncbi:MAG: GGDEF domain-containing protein, partial [Lachnospiraceae bacterium]|nr:GGDEF domain-containing protein [Lachnospiraceae bacterium]